MRGEPSTPGPGGPPPEPSPGRSTPAPPGRPGATAAPLSPAGWTVAALGLVAAVGLADFLTGTEVSVTLLYLAPIGFATWFVSLRAGLFLSGAAAAVSLGSDALHRLGTGEADLRLALLAWNGLVQLGTTTALVLVLAALRSRLEAEELLARTDALTGVANRRAFFEAAALELERTRRTGRPLTLAYLDCDGFKDVNDRRGHAQGDALLAEVARALRAGTRAVDAVARLGGDEFGLLLPETDAAEAAALLGRLRAALLEATARGGWPVGFTVGAATFLAPPASIDEMMARADALMYAAKREERGSVRHGVFDGGRGVAAAR